MSILDCIFIVASIIIIGLALYYDFIVKDYTK